MDLVSVHPVFNLYNREWPIYTASSQLPPAKFVFEETGRTGHGARLDRRRGVDRLRGHGPAIGDLSRRAGRVARRWSRTP